jgi:hypothetical protein
MAEMRRYNQAGAVFTEDMSSLQDLRERGTVTGNPTIVDTARGRATLFDGSNDYVAMTGSTPILGTSDFSVVLWVKNSQTLAGDNDFYVVLSDKQGTNGSFVGWAVALHGGINNGLELRINDGDAANDTVIQVSTDRTTLLSDGNWHCIALTADRDGNALLYVDDNAGEGGAISAQAKTMVNDQDLTVAAYGAGSSLFGGATRGTMICDRLLSAVEISQICSNTVWDYDLDEVSVWDMSNVNPPDVSFKDNGNDGTGTGLDSTNIVDGPYNGGKALEFNGTDEVVGINYDTSLDFTASSNFSMSILFRTSTTTNNQGLFSRTVSSIWDYLFYTQDSGSRILFGRWGTGGVKTASTAGLGTANDGAWHHLVGVVSDGSVYLIFDGQKSAETSGYGTITLPDTTVPEIGRFITNYFAGTIAALNVYCCPLSQLQVADLGARLAQEVV